jgi:uncharacterized protein
MYEQLSLLCELQDIDTRMSEAQARLDALVEVPQTEQKIVQYSAAHAKAAKTLLEREAQAKDLDLQLKSIEEKRSTYEKKLYSGKVTNPKELSAMEKEIAMLKEQQAQLDEKTLVALESAGNAREKEKSLAKSCDVLQKRLEHATKLESGERAEMEKLLADIRPRRDALAAKITDKALYARYESVRQRNHSTGMAYVVDGKCGGCRVGMRGITMQELRVSESYACCENCGRILVAAAK